MTYPLLTLAYLFILSVGPMRVQLLLSAPLIFIDCVGSVLIGESFHTTLSAKAADARANGQRYWGWTAAFIDTLFFFQYDHCNVQLARERTYDGVWRAWLAQWNGA